MWTKGDVFHVLQYDDKESGQLVGGIFVLIKTPEIVELVNVWNFLSQQYQLIGDYPSYHPNDPSFQEHRHDQSIFGILRKNLEPSRLPMKLGGLNNGTRINIILSMHVV